MPPEGPKFLPFRVIPKLAASELRHMLQRREAGHGEASSVSWSRPALTWERAAGESWKLGHYSVEAVFNLFQGYWATPPWPVGCGLWGARVTHRTQEAEWVSTEWDPFTDGGWLHNFCPDIALFLSPCLGAMLQVILRRNSGVLAPTGYKNDFILDSLYFIEVCFILVS